MKQHSLFKPAKRCAGTEQDPISAYLDLLSLQKPQLQDRAGPRQTKTAR